MPFLTPDELKTHIYTYQVDAISVFDPEIATIAIATAEEECRSYLEANYQTKYRDGRYIYDCDAIFSAEGSDRSPVILSNTKTLAVYHLCQLSNVDVFLEHIKDRYDASIKWLTRMASGENSLSTLPKKQPDTDGDISTMPEAFILGSRKKFNHE